jgi:predicted DNA-binding protein with PD1-like motif
MIFKHSGGMIMELIKGNVSSEIIIIRFNPGEKFLEGLKQVIKEEGIRGGIIVSGIGTLSTAQFHQCVAGFPPNLLTRHQDYFELNGSFEIASIQGIIADGEPHIHMAFGEKEQMMAGHVEDGCIVLTLLELVILRADAIPMKRIYSQPEKIKQLTSVADVKQ